MVLTYLTKYRDLGLLILRIGLGLMFILHGFPRLAGGPEAWAKLGQAMGHLGITFFPVFWGFMAAISLTIGGGLLVIGLLFRPAVILLALTMTVAALTEVDAKKSLRSNLMAGAHPIEMAIVFYSLILIGPGRFSVDKN